jgi:hypothetical protein
LLLVGFPASRRAFVFSPGLPGCASPISGGQSSTSQQRRRNFMNIGEEICGEWLRHKRKCEFIQYNLKIPGIQGEIDVIGLNVKDRTVYACEVAIHLVTGLKYVNPDNVARLTAKFRKDIAYLCKEFPDYKRVYMLWSPVVKNQKSGAKHNQLKDVKEIADKLKSECQGHIEMIVNRKFQEALEALRGIARGTKKEMDSSVMRYLQIEEYLSAHLLSAGMKDNLTLPSRLPGA